MRYRYMVLDVFTDRRFCGNPLAVLPESQGLDDAAMQAIAREFNLSETSFVLPPRDTKNLAAVRIFTPAHELPFSGHPTVGTAFALALEKRILADSDQEGLVLEEQAGEVPLTVEFTAGTLQRVSFRAPAEFTKSPCVDASIVTDALGIERQQLAGSVTEPVLASCGTPFLIVTIEDAGLLAALSPGRLANLAQLDVGVLIATRDVSEQARSLGAAWQARMFAPVHGVAEDPATGSAAAAFAGLLAERAPEADGTFSFKLAQGLEMGRPSIIETSTVKRNGRVTEVHVGGQAVLVAEGTIDV